MTEKATNLRLLSIFSESKDGNGSSVEEQSTQPLLAEAKAWQDRLLQKPSTGDHVVQFYEDDEFLVDAVAHFVAAGLAADEPIVIVATEPHREAFVQRLRRNGSDVDVAVASGQMIMLDAKQTLLRFMVDDEPDWNRFRATIAPALERCRGTRSGARVRVFGEMVDLLWRAGNRVAAIRLEELWNDLARQQSFTLLCAYAMANFFMPGDLELFDKVRGRHSHVVPGDGAGRSVRSLEAELDQRKQLEGALRDAIRKRAVTAGATEEISTRNAERFRVLVESVKDYAIFMLDAGGRVTSWNIGAERIKGYRAEEIIGQHFSRFYPLEDVGKCEMELEVAAREGRFEDEGWRVRKDGTRFWANVVISRMLDSDGGLIGFAKVTRDLSQRRQLEDERVARASLEQVLAEQKKTEQLREQLIGIVGHDLRSPLSSITTGVAVMLKRGMLSPPDAKVAARIARSGDRMSNIITQLLDFTRTRLGGGIPVDPKPIDLAEICTEVIDEMESAHPDRTLLFAADGDSRGVWDRVRIAQVVSNLITNAIKYGKRDAAIAVEVGGEDDRVTLSVHNEGPPIAAEFLPTIFEPFRRQHNAAARGEGLGLGLYICREMVRAHGGEISVQSDGTGTTFTVGLPRSAKSDAALP
jgi:PAS domain S-box-containing protein